MIINHEHKYIFVGFPYSASSTISKELVENYGGERLFLKHSTLLSLTGKKQYKGYKTFAVFRSPLSIWSTQYYKLMESSVFDSEKYLRSNGGHISKKAFNLSKRMRSEEWSYADYIQYKSTKGYPYISIFVANYKKFEHIIRFDRLQDDWLLVMKELGHLNISPLPLYNATSDKELYEHNTVPNFVAPFLYYTRALHEDSNYRKNARFVLNVLLFSLLRRPLKIYWFFQERRKKMSSLDKEYK